MNWLVLGGSLVAVLATAGLVAWLGLGRGAVIAEEQAARLAEQLLHDFTSRDVFVDRQGRSALVRGDDGSFALLRIQGAHPVARRINSPIAMQKTPEGVVVSTGERRFGKTLIANDELLALL